MTAFSETLSWKIGTGLESSSARPATTPSIAVPRPLTHAGSSRILRSAFAPDGLGLATGDDDGSIILWDLPSFHGRAVLPRQPGSIRALAYASDGRSLVTASGDWAEKRGQLSLWDASTGRERSQLFRDDRPITAVAVSPDGTKIVAGSGDGTLRVWEVNSRLPRVLAEAHTDEIHALTFSRDGRSLASASADRSVVLWDTATFHPRQSLRGHQSVVWDVAFAPENDTLASASSDRTIRLWDVSSGRDVGILHGHRQPVRALAFAPKGGFLLSGEASPQEDASLRLWNIYDGTSQQVLLSPSGIYSLGFAPDGRTLAVATRDGALRLWSWKTLQARIAPNLAANPLAPAEADSFHTTPRGVSSYLSYLTGREAV